MFFATFHSKLQYLHVLPGGAVYTLQPMTVWLQLTFLSLIVEVTAVAAAVYQKK